MDSISQKLYFLVFIFCIFVAHTNSLCVNQSASETVTVCFPNQHYPDLCSIKKRRKVIEDIGWPNWYHGWADVQGQGAANDYCRFVGLPNEMQLSCALAGPYDRYNDRNFNSSYNLPMGFDKTWYMKDEDGDGRDDYCRCLEKTKGNYAIVCTKAGEYGFFGSPEQGGESLTFTVPVPYNCQNMHVSEEFGKVIPS